MTDDFAPFIIDSSTKACDFIKHQCGVKPYSDYVETEEYIYSDDNDEEIDEHFSSYDDKYEDGNMAQAEYDQG